jgi:hypothetical protein
MECLHIIQPCHTHDITLSVHLTVLYFPISNNTRVVLQTYADLAGFSQGRQLLHTMRLAAHNMVMLLPLLLMVSWVPSLVRSHGEVWALAVVVREEVFMEGSIEPNMGPSLADVLLCTFASTNAGFSSFPVRKLLSIE